MTSNGWIDLTTPASAYEIGFNAYTRQYRHRVNRIIPSDSDPSVLIVRAIAAADWLPGMPPPYPHYPT